ncbi:phosphoglycerate mutase family protein, partial [Teladorsagia circumcincta]
MKTPSRILWFVRHGERVDNVDKAWKKTAERWDDPPLSARGHQQAREVGVALQNEPIDYVICSPFTRVSRRLQKSSHNGRTHHVFALNLGWVNR